MDLLFLLTIVPAYLVASFFVKNDPGPEEPRSAITSAVWFGVVAIGLALLFSFAFELLISGDFLARVSNADSETSLPLFLDVLLFATIEELVKFIPIALYLLRKDFFNEITDGIIYFAIVGLTFGAIESFLYGLTAGAFGFIVALMRLALGLFFHGALTAIVGYFFAKAKIMNKGMMSAILALAVVSVAHAFYNYFVFSIQGDPLFIFGAAAVALTANAAMFWLYFVAIRRDIELGLAGPQFVEARKNKYAQARYAAQQKMHPPEGTQQQPPQPQPQPRAGMPAAPPQQMQPPQPIPQPQPQQMPQQGQARMPFNPHNPDPPQNPPSQGIL